ncbi:MAG: DNA translocase FtsK, partial [Acidobacteriota bacterium]|nr:DNA translocase FtsK [Acidobacteriota bacterium]
YFNHIGTIIVLIGLLILLITFSTRISIGKILRFFSRFFSFAFKEVKIRIIHYRKEKHREKMRRNVIEKYSAIKHEDKKKQRKIEIKKEPALQKPGKVLTREKYLFPEMERKGDYNFPPLNLLDPGKAAEKIDNNELYQKKEAIEEKLLEFKVEGEVKEYHPGPILTTYEFYPHPGVKVSQVAGLSEDLSLRLGAESIRIQRIPGKSSLGLEVPNNKREIIKIRDIIQSEKFQNSPSKLTFALGKTIHGEVYVTDLAIMPHLLIAGATGSGKSVALNALIASILYKATPDEVKLILIDPKRLEFSLYDGIPHLLCPVVKDPKKVEAVLLNSIRNMEERYHKLGFLKVKNIEQYNQQVKRIRNERKGKLTEEEEKNLTPLPYIVIIIDELSELMMIGAREVEYSIARIAQLARAVGIHLVLATQRPSTDVITGTIKNNFASRIAFHVPSKIDSRVIIDTGGAEKLLGQGDMLFMPPNYPRILRLHCSFISLSESTRVINFIKQQKKPVYDKNILKALKSPVGHFEESSDEKDPLFYKAVELILLTGQASASYLQRKLKLGYARASRIIDQMEQEGIVGHSEGSKAREILVDPESYLRKIET